MSSLNDMLTSAFAANENETEATYNPYMDLELEDLLKVASAATTAPETAVEDTPVLDASDLDALGGEIMAHALFQEFDFIREKVASGVCRVCKENALDTRGSSICSACAADNG